MCRRNCGKPRTSGAGHVVGAEGLPDDVLADVGRDEQADDDDAREEQLRAQATRGQVSVERLYFRGREAPMHLCQSIRHELPAPRRVTKSWCKRLCRVRHERPLATATASHKM